MTSVVGAIGIARIESRHCSYIITGSTGNITLFTCRSIKIKTIYARWTTSYSIICANGAIWMTETTKRFCWVSPPILQLSSVIRTNIDCMVSCSSFINWSLIHSTIWQTSSSCITNTWVSGINGNIKEVSPVASWTCVISPIIITPCDCYIVQVYYISRYRINVITSWTFPTTFLTSISI